MNDDHSVIRLETESLQELCGSTPTAVHLEILRTTIRIARRWHPRTARACRDTSDPPPCNGRRPRGPEVPGTSDQAYPDWICGALPDPRRRAERLSHSDIADWRSARPETQVDDGRRPAPVPTIGVFPAPLQVATGLPYSSTAVKDFVRSHGSAPKTSPTTVLRPRKLRDRDQAVSLGPHRRQVGGPLLPVFWSGQDQPQPSHHRPHPFPRSHHLLPAQVGVDLPHSPGRVRTRKLANLRLQSRPSTAPHRCGPTPRLVVRLVADPEHRAHLPHRCPPVSGVAVHLDHFPGIVGRSARMRSSSSFLMATSVHARSTCLSLFSSLQLARALARPPAAAPATSPPARSDATSPPCSGVPRSAGRAGPHGPCRTPVPGPLSHGPPCCVSPISTTPSRS